MNKGERFWVVARESETSPVYICRGLYADFETAKKHVALIIKEMKECDGVMPDSAEKSIWTLVDGRPAIVYDGVVFSLHEVFPPQR